MSSDARAQIASLGEEVSLGDGARFIVEGEQADTVYVLVSGQVQVLKKTPWSGEESVVATLQAPQVVGEIGLFDGSPRTATVRALGTVEAVALPVAAMRDTIAEDPELARHFLFADKGIAQQIRASNERLSEIIRRFARSHEARLDMGRLTIAVVVCLCFYTLALDAIRQANRMVSSYTWINIVLTLVFVGAISLVIRRSRQPLRAFGITLLGFRRAVLESVALTAGVIGVLTAAKAIALGQTDLDSPLFVVADVWSGHFDRGPFPSQAVWLQTLLAYVLLIAPAQEMIVRGGLQSSLSLFLGGKHRRLIAILLSNLIFSTTHLVYPTSVVALVFVAGCYWGWLYDRHGTLVGVIVSHALLGGWTLWIMGLPMVT